MPRLNIERQNKLEPLRMQTAIDSLNKLGIKLHYQSETELQFLWLGKMVYFFPYSGWHSGSSINPGRGLQKLLKQLIKK